MFGFGVKKDAIVDGRLNCILGEDSRFRGEVSIKGSARIDGEFEGLIVASESLIIGRAGVVRADMEARDVIIAGSLFGGLKATGRVELHEGARVDGDIEASTFVVEEGVVFNGRCGMRSSPEGTSEEGAHTDGPGRPDQAERDAHLSGVGSREEF